LVFERKTLKDFARSIVDGRLFRQAIRLANSKYKSVLILEGTGKELQSVEGIGESIAERIKWAVREHMQPYGVIDEFPI
jgi:ERCC4-type nuclease